MNKGRLAGIIAMAALALGAVAVAGCGGGTTTTSSTASPGTTASQSPTQVLPVTSNPITNTSTKPGLKITEIMVENNVDPATKKDLTDRLQFSLKNTSTATMTDLEAFYDMTDSNTGATESYYQKLTGLTLAPGETKTVYFDNETGPGHYPENTYSLYRTSKNKVVVTVQVSAPGYAIATAEVTKDAGTGETAGE